MDALTPRDIERALAAGAESYQRATVNSWLRVMPMLNAQRGGASGAIATNPAAHVHAPRERRDEEGDEEDEWTS